jgi:ketosteroid isomerase-like protein
MNRSKNLLPCLMGLALFFSMTPVAASNRPPIKEEAEIRSVLERQVDAWNRGDLAEFMKGYWNSPDLLFTSGGHIRRGWQTTLDQYKQSYPDKARMGTLSFSNLEFHFVGSTCLFRGKPTAAWVLGQWRLDRAADSPHGTFTLIFQSFPNSPGKDDGGWKIVHDHTSSGP